ncbi:MAG: tRNA 2-thiouridine(34) synthase MnmA [Oscillospiraceae bacterium]|nr:tRNA 2-thiouridine(34) synthase MnmA [Oscillospiraceae bacterium]
MAKALIAMSGGVDSSAVALLMRDSGYDCAGAMMKLHGGESFEDARLVCDSLGIPFYGLDFSGEFSQNVIEKFVHSYEIGETPNPCIECNRHMKFGILHKKAAELGCDCIATGHYARVEFDEKWGRWLLKKALNQAKDQSYVLYFLNQEQLARVRFPLGNFTNKEQVRAIAAESGLPTASKGESQDICFVPNGDYAGFISRFTGKEYPGGEFRDLHGNVLGQHRGVIRYTIGQRKGLGISHSEPLYVVSKSVSENAVTLSMERDLYSSELTARDFNWISLTEPPTEPISVSVRTRYHALEAAATAVANPNGTVTIRFVEPQRAISPGQAVVLYDGEIVVGGGTICASC